jgi:2-phosphoglycerate kinase
VTSVTGAMVGSDTDPLIVLIGGTAGCGKTTLANDVLARFDLDHRLGTGFIRAVLQSQTSPTSEPALFTRSYQSNDPVRHIRAQSGRLRPAVWACIERARADGTSLVVEGTHLLPELYHDVGACFVVLEPPDPDEHRRRLVGHRHTRRSISLDDVTHIREIGRFYMEQAIRFGIPTLRFSDNFDDVIAALGLTPTAPDGVAATSHRSSKGQVDP